MGHIWHTNDVNYDRVIDHPHIKSRMLLTGREAKGRDGMSEDKEPTPEELKTKVEELEAQLKRINAESAGRRKELEKIAAEKAEKDKAALSEIEKLQAEVKAGRAETAELKGELQAERVRTAILTAANELGFASSEDAMALIDLSEVTVTGGKVSGFEKSLKALAESGRLAMADQKRSDGLGTPGGKGKPPSGLDEQEAPIVRF